MATCTIWLNDSYKLVLSVSPYAQTGTDKSKNQTRIAWSAYLHKGSGSGKYAQGPHTWKTTIDGVNANGTISGYDFRNYSQLKLGSGNRTIKHGSDGKKTVAFGASYSESGYGELGSGSCTGSQGLPNIDQATPPGAPPAAQFTRHTQTSFQSQIFQPSNNGGSKVLGYELELKTAGGLVARIQEGASYHTWGGLIPGTQFGLRYRARNAKGWGSFNAWRYTSTLPLEAPTLTVTPAPGGTSVTLTATRGGTLQPDKWVIQWERVPAPPTGDYKTAGTGAHTQAGLVRGAKYRFRAAAFMSIPPVQGDYTGPYSAWITVTMPKPNTEPGEYFDGSSPNETDVAYTWTGASNNSTSVATGIGVRGWNVSGADAANAVLYRSTGSRTQVFSATAIFVEDTPTDSTVTFGTDRSGVDASDVVALAFYTGSVYVRLSDRDQLLAAVLLWDDGTESVGTPELIEADGGWVRLSVRGQSPAGAVSAGVGVIDVAGTGWSEWISGDVIDLDDAMLTIGDLLPYFDGETSDNEFYEYAWDGSTNASPSFRTATPQEGFDPLEDPDCPPIPNAPRPPMVTDPCLIDVGVWRRYWAVIPINEISKWLAVIPTIRLTTGSDAARQVRIRVYENPDNREPDQFFTDDPVGEQTISYMPPNAEYLLDGVTERLRGRVGGSEWLEADHLLYGTLGTPAVWPVLTCGVGYLISFDVPLDAPDGNLNIDVELTRRF